MKQFESMRLVVGHAEGPKSELHFSVRPTDVAQRWARAVSLANQHSKILESKRWYNFPGHSNSQEKAIAAQIDNAIQELNLIFPGVISERIDPGNIQGSVNRIHTHFADTEMDQRFVNEATSKLWRDLNNSLHAYESFERSRETQKSAGIPECNIVVTWENPSFEPLQPHDYEHFSVAKKFGTLYVNYCQIGRHLYEMFLADDNVASDEHILPLRRLSADTYVWLGSTTGPQSLIRRQNAIKEWFHKNEARLNALSFFWNDPQLAIGWIPVADLQGEYSQLKDQVRLVEDLAQYEEVLALEAIPVVPL